MRLIKISPSLNRVSVSTYSPYLDSFKTDDHNQFVVPYRNPGVSTAPGTLSGKAKNAVNCAPAAGVTVSDGSNSAITDSNGNFTMPANARKSMAIIAGKAGWTSNARFGTSTPSTAEPSPTKVFVSTTGKISGHVLNSGGAPVGGATLTFTGGKLRLSKTVVTDGSGAYSSSWIAVGSYTVSVSATGYAAASGAATVNTGLTTTLNLSLHP